MRAHSCHHHRSSFGRDRDVVTQPRGCPRPCRSRLCLGGNVHGDGRDSPLASMCRCLAWMSRTRHGPHQAALVRPRERLVNSRWRRRTAVSGEGPRASAGIRYSAQIRRRACITDDRRLYLGRWSVIAPATRTEPSRPRPSEKRSSIVSRAHASVSWPRESDSSRRVRGRVMEIASGRHSPRRSHRASSPAAVAFAPRLREAPPQVRDQQQIEWKSLSLTAVRSGTQLGTSARPARERPDRRAAIASGRDSEVPSSRRRGRVEEGAERPLPTLATTLWPRSPVVSRPSTLARRIESSRKDIADRLGSGSRAEVFGA